MTDSVEATFSPVADFLVAAQALLPEAAGLSLRLSPQLCRHGGGHYCGGYHGMRPLLLWFGMDTGPSPHKEFFRIAIADAVREGARRVLVSGAADYQLPALVLWACAATGLTPELSVIDLCQTPLRLCTWFGERTGATIETVVGDIAAYRPERPFDLVCVHSFLGYFPPSDWAGLIAGWNRSLAPGGRVILVNRYRPHAPETVGFSAAQADAFQARVLDRARNQGRDIGIDPDQVAAMIADHVEYLVMHALRSVDALTAVFEAGGFRIAALEVDEPDPARAQNSSGPALAGGAEYVKLVAVKR